MNPLCDVVTALLFSTYDRRVNTRCFPIQTITATKTESNTDYNKIAPTSTCPYQFPSRTGPQLLSPFCRTLYSPQPHNHINCKRASQSSRPSQTNLWTTKTVSSQTPFVKLDLSNCPEERPRKSSALFVNLAQPRHRLVLHTSSSMNDF